MNNIDVHELFEIFASNNPDPRIELSYRNEYTLLVAVILSARSTDISVNKVTEDLFKTVDTPYKMIEFGEDNLKSCISVIGLYNSKAKNIMKMSFLLIENYHGFVPNNFDELVMLPGVGSKSAKVFLNTMYSEPLIAVDTHVFRVSNRIGLVCEKSIAKTELVLQSIVPEKWVRRAHHWLVLHGRYVCKSIRPLCERCIVNHLCAFFRKTRPNA